MVGLVELSGGWLYEVLYVGGWIYEVLYVGVELPGSYCLQLV